jgi:hypothetical protein
MKRKNRIPNRPIVTSKARPDGGLSSMESINAIENELVDEADRESIEAVARDYEGRSADEEDGAIPMDPADQDAIPAEALRRPGRPPRHNI